MEKAAFPHHVGELVVGEGKDQGDQHGQQQAAEENCYAHDGQENQGGQDTGPQHGHTRSSLWPGSTVQEDGGTSPKRRSRVA